MNKKDFLLVSFILVFGFLTRFYRLDYAAGRPIFDEIKYYREAALSYLQNRDDPNFEHPPLSKELFAFSISRFGDNAYGWRMPSLVFSLFGNVVIYFFIRDLFGRRLIGFLTSLFLSLDFLYFIHSRLAVPEMILATLSWAALYFLWRFLKTPRLKLLIAGSIFFGLAFSTKWTAVLVLIPYTFRMIRSKKFGALLVSLITLLLITLLLYPTAYLPYLNRHGFSALLNLQPRILWYWVDLSEKLGANLSPGLYFLNHAYAWILNPGWAYDFSRPAPGQARIVWAFFHPLLWFASLTLVVVEIYQRGFRLFRDAKSFCLLAILSFFVPWLLVTRIQYPYYFLIGLPFLYAFLAEKASSWQKTRPERFWVLMIITVVAVAAFYPLLSNRVVPEKYLELILRSRIVEGT